ncbi:hypothetical protein CYJ36_15585 [Bacillus sp. UMB0893]|nr:hypothetical protein CYJ36_15585 [Bacillus sp. UMB0893]
MLTLNDEASMNVWFSDFPDSRAPNSSNGTLDFRFSRFEGAIQPQWYPGFEIFLIQGRQTAPMVP